MSAGLPSDEVADDYKNSLEDLVTNDRYQIGNLTVIARENIEHGETIARVLENHIQRVGTSFPLVFELPLVPFHLHWEKFASSRVFSTCNLVICITSCFLMFSRHHPLENFLQYMCWTPLSRMSELRILSTSDAISTTLL